MEEILETDYGFATYRFLPEEGAVYIIEIYILPEYRKQGFASRIADEVGAIAREKGFHHMLGTVNPGAKGSTDSLKVLLAYGMELKSSDATTIVLGKGI